MSGSDYSGWGGDDKGAPMVVVSPGSSGDGGSSGRTTMILLVTALVFALGIAAWSLIELNSSNKTWAGKVGDKEREMQLKIDKLNATLGSTSALVDTENVYTDKLEADNAALEKNVVRAKATPAPEPTPHQHYVVALEKRNTALRAGKPAPPAQPRSEDPLKPRPTRS